ncbi:MAG: VOC family protein [Flavobacteriaceae bacterium]|nr:VOC family protein [Flavobacteriaceae bacterium]MCY4267329.1 VOC family protein [Flavobacteriaceae bacterium]
MILHPFLLFAGNAHQVIEFYCQALGLTCTFKNTYENSPIKVPSSQKQWILHSELSFNNQPFLMIADVDSTESGNKISLSLNFRNLDEMKQKFQYLSFKGKITKPIERQFWKAHYGELKDQFGVSWMFNCQNKIS